MKYIKFFLISSLFFLSAAVKASPPDWTVNANAFSYSMTYTGVVYLNNVELAGTNYQLGAFVGNECRGVAVPVYRESINRYVFYLMAYSNTAGETLNFKIYKADTDEIISIPVSQPFVVNGIMGTIDVPYVWSNPTLSDEASLLTFTLPDQLQQFVADDSIWVQMPYGTNLTNLVAQFTTSPMAKVSVGNATQTSGVTANNFEQTVTYSVRSADGMTLKLYKIYVTNRNLLQIPDLLAALPEKTELETQIHQFPVDGAYPDDILQYSISNDFGGTFLITDQGKLILKKYLNYNTTKQYIFTASVTDGIATATSNVEINVEFEPLTQFLANKILSPGDPKLGTWNIEFAHLYQDSQFMIFTANGAVVFEQTGYDKAWDGTYNGNELPLGVYFYLITTPEGEHIKGSITLIR